jgi:hypothetical protein
VFIYESDGLPAAKILNGARWSDVIDGEYPADLQGLIEREVGKRIDSDFKHIEKKDSLLKDYQAIARERFQAAGEDDQDPEFLALSAMRKPIREIIGLPAITQ